MAERDLSSSEASDLTNAITDFSVTPQSTDGALDQKETTYQNTMWTTHLGYYKTIPELKRSVDTKANWVVGNGFEADPQTELLLGTIKGNGKDNFNSILKNMERTCYIGEDAYSEIIRNEEGILINLKPLSPDSIVIVQNSQGRVKRYEQVARTGGFWNKVKNRFKGNKKFKPEEIFVLSNDRIADEMHGISMIPVLQNVIDARNEAMEDWRKVLHWNVRPRWKIQLDTDDVTKIAAFKKKYDAANALGENFYVPKGTVEIEVLGVAPNASLNPLTWIEMKNDNFYQAAGVPQIIVGNAKSFTDASGKIVYLAFEQEIKGRQKYVEEQVLNQLNLEINLVFPATLQNELISSREKDPNLQAAQPNDTTEELEGKK